MTGDEVKIATDYFNRRPWPNPLSRFKGEVRVVNGADMAVAYERETGHTLEPGQRERAERYYRVVFVSALPTLDCGSHDVVIRVDKATGEVTEEVWD